MVVSCSLFPLQYCRKPAFPGAGNPINSNGYHSLFAQGNEYGILCVAPFAATLAAEVAAGKSLADAWNAAAAAATDAAKATAELTPKLGRARSHTARSLGHPDAGAISLALCARIVGAAIAR